METDTIKGEIDKSIKEFINKYVDEKIKSEKNNRSDKL